MKTDLNELIAHQIIDEETAQRIRQYYKEKEAVSKSSRFLLILSLIGIVLVGLGIILIIAYNWDDLSKWTKLVIAFLPLLAAQGLGIFTLKRKQGNTVWTESSALTILFSLAIAISLISQIYNIESAISGFIKWWMILSLPLLFVFNSRAISLALWMGVGWYLTTISWSKNQVYDLFPLSVMLLISAWYWYQLKNRTQNNLLIFHHWIIPNTLTIFLFFHTAYLCERFVIMACLILLLGFGALAFTAFSGLKFLSNGYRSAQFLGIWIIGMVMTFDFYWEESNSGLLIPCLQIIHYPVATLLLLLLGLISYLYISKKITLSYDNMWWLGFGLIVVLLIGEINAGLGQILSNLLVLAGAARLVYGGVTREDLILVNTGLMVLTIWILAWFFGHDFSFIWKGLVFIALGILCFGINRMIIKRQQT